MKTPWLPEKELTVIIDEALQTHYFSKLKESGSSKNRGSLDRSQSPSRTSGSSPLPNRRSMRSGVDRAEIRSAVDRHANASPIGDRKQPASPSGDELSWLPPSSHASRDASPHRQRRSDAGLSLDERLLASPVDDELPSSGHHRRGPSFAAGMSASDQQEMVAGTREPRRGSAGGGDRRGSAIDAKPEGLFIKRTSVVMSGGGGLYADQGEIKSRHGSVVGNMPPFSSPNTQRRSIVGEGVGASLRSSLAVSPPGGRTSFAGSPGGRTSFAASPGLRTSFAASPGLRTSFAGSPGGR